MRPEPHPEGHASVCNFSFDATGSWPRRSIVPRANRGFPVAPAQSWRRSGSCDPAGAFLAALDQGIGDLFGLRILRVLLVRNFFQNAIRRSLTFQHAEI